MNSEGKIQLPYIEPIVVRGKEISQVLSSVKEEFEAGGILTNQGLLGISVEFLMRAHDPQEIRNVTGAPAIEKPLVPNSPGN